MRMDKILSEVFLGGVAMLGRLGLAVENGIPREEVGKLTRVIAYGSGSPEAVIHLMPGQDDTLAAGARHMAEAIRRAPTEDSLRLDGLGALEFLVQDYSGRHGFESLAYLMDRLNILKVGIDIPREFLNDLTETDEETDEGVVGAEAMIDSADSLWKAYILYRFWGNKAADALMEKAASAN